MAPILTGLAAVGGAGAGGGLGLIGSLVSGVFGAAGAKAEADAQAEAAEDEAKIKRKQAQEERARGSEEAQKTLREKEQKLASNNALLAAQGQSTTEGTPLLLQSSLSQEYDSLAKDQQEQGDAFGRAKEDDALIAERRADNARKAGRIKAAGSLFGSLFG